MKAVSPRIMAFMDEWVISSIVEKYGLTEKEATEKFMFSETYKMLKDYETALYQLSPLAVFDMWEVEQITGEPRNSVYIREVNS